MAISVSISFVPALEQETFYPRVLYSMFWLIASQICIIRCYSYRQIVVQSVGRVSLCLVGLKSYNSNFQRAAAAAAAAAAVVVAAAPVVRSSESE